MIRRHPSTEQLRRWLHDDTPVDGPDLTAHIDNCHRCAAKLEHLAIGDDLERSDLGSILSSVLAPNAGLSDRVEGKVIDRLGSRQMLSVLGDLFGAGLETSKLLLTEEDL
ncbi:MAG: hypothetical protein R2710_21190 [Acidimicrobiales bacterium]